MDDDGVVTIVDRIDMIVTDGENEFSAEVENAVFDHSAVANAPWSASRARNGVKQSTLS
jgi:acyl-CoA synthetase (AMP-forming)/AMP-acid ligase II